MKSLHVFGIVMLLFCGCSSLVVRGVESGGRLLDGSALAGKTVAVYQGRAADGTAVDIELRETRGKSGQRGYAITLKQFPALTIRCSAPDDTGEFYLTALDYLGSSVSGWNEYRLDLSGTGHLVFSGTSAVLSVPQAPQPIQISSGRIHRYDTRLTGGEAAANLRNRRERILSLAEWMNGRENAPQGASRAEFEKYWKPVLFPEMVWGKRRPAGWKREGDRRVKAEDIRWNTGYTEREFPQPLWIVRNSGTMLRDWEEALEWIYSEYEWERVMRSLSGEIHLAQTKPKIKAGR